MRTLPPDQAPLMLSHLDPCGLVLSRRGGQGGAGGVQWAARSTSHAVTCDYLVGRGLRVCSCRASRAATH